MKNYLLIEVATFEGEIARFSDKKEAIKFMLRYNLEQSTYNQWAKKVGKYGFPLVKLSIN